MATAVVFSPSEESVSNSIGARNYLNRLAKKLDIENRTYRSLREGMELPEDVHSVAVMAGLSDLMLQSGYMEMELDTVFEPQELLKTLREMLPPEFPVIAVVDDVYSDYIMATYLKSGASAVVGTDGQLFGVVVSRLGSWDQIGPYINQFRIV